MALSQQERHDLSTKINAVLSILRIDRLWDISVEEGSLDGELATVERPHSDYDARVTVKSSAWRSWDDDFLWRVLAHEVLHLLFFDMEKTCQVLLSSSSSPAKDATARAIIRLEVERIIAILERPIALAARAWWEHRTSASTSTDRQEQGRRRRSSQSSRG